MILGKRKDLTFFIENQMNIENPHNHLDPETSKDIIIAHAADGGEMIRKHRLPKELDRYSGTASWYYTFKVFLL